MGELTALFGTVYMQWVVLLVAVDVVLGIVAAAVKGTLNLGQLAAFMKKDILPYVLGLAVVEMVVQALPAYEIVLPTVFILIVIALASSILGNLGQLGLPVPKIVQKAKA